MYHGRFPQVPVTAILAISVTLRGCLTLAAEDPLHDTDITKAETLTTGQLRQQPSDKGVREGGTDRTSSWCRGSAHQDNELDWGCLGC